MAETLGSLGPMKHPASKPAIYFLHGTAGEAGDFELQIRCLKSSYRCEAFSWFPEQKLPSYSIPALADRVQALVQDDFAHRSDAEPYVLVGHSLGGLIALEIAAREPRGLLGIALVDTPMFVPAEVADALRPLGAAFKSDGYSDALRSFAETYFFAPSDDVATKQRLLSRLLAFPKEAFNAIWEATGAFDAAAAAREARVPALYVHSSVPIDLEAFRTVYAGPLKIVRTTGTSHYSPIFDSDEVNHAIEAFVEGLTGSAPGLSAPGSDDRDDGFSPVVEA